MTPVQTRVSACDRHDAQTRLTHAQKFLEVAELVAGVAVDDLEYASVAASLAVLSGIAAADAASCFALGQRSRSQNHHDAEALIAQIAGDGKKAAAELRRLLNIKDQAQYGVIHVSGDNLRGAIRRAEYLVKFAERVLQS